MAFGYLFCNLLACAKCLDLLLSGFELVGWYAPRDFWCFDVLFAYDFVCAAFIDGIVWLLGACFGCGWWFVVG